MLVPRRYIEATLIAIILILWGAAPHIIEDSDAVIVTAERNCKPLLAVSSNGKWTSDSCQKLTLSTGTLVIIGGVDPITVHTTIGEVELPPGYATAVQQDNDLLRVTVIGYRERVRDPLRSSRSVLVTTNDDNVYELHPTQRLIVSIINNEITDIATTEMSPDYYEKLRVAAAELSLSDLRSDLNGYELSIRMANQWTKLLLSLLGVDNTSDKDRPSILVAESDKFIVMQPGFLKDTTTAAGKPQRASYVQTNTTSTVGQQLKTAS